MQCRQHSLQACGPLESPLTAGLRLRSCRHWRKGREGNGEDEEGYKEQKRRGVREMMTGVVKEEMMRE